MPWSFVRPHALIASVDDQWYAFPADSIGEIVHMAELSTTAGKPRFLEGFLNLRGTLAPVVSLRRLLNLEDRPAEVYSPLILLQGVALRADAVIEVAPIPEDSSLRPLGDLDSYNGCARCIFTHGDREVVLIAPDLLFNAKEKACLADLLNDAQRRLAGLLAPTTTAAD